MKRIIIALLLIVPMIVSAQWGMTPNQAMVKESIEPSLVVVCCAYKLQDSSGQRYGRNNRSEFSQGYTLGVRTDSGLVVAASVLQPWLFDADFTRYRQSHTPVLSTVSCRQLGDSTYKVFPLSTDSTSTPWLLQMPADSVKNVPALAVHADTAYKNGWLLWVYVSDTLGKAGFASTTAVMASVELNDSVRSQRVNAPSLSGLVRDSLASRKVVGAVWVVPSYPRAGMVQFRVAGMAVRDSTGWLLVPLYSNKENAAVSVTQETATDGELTPSPDAGQPKEKKDKKNKKNN